MCEATVLLRQLEKNRPRVLDKEAHELAREIAKDRRKALDAMSEIIAPSQPKQQKVR